MGGRGRQCDLHAHLAVHEQLRSVALHKAQSLHRTVLQQHRLGRGATSITGSAGRGRNNSTRLEQAEDGEKGRPVRDHPSHAAGPRALDSTR